MKTESEAVKDPYQVLGVGKNASADEIKSAYRKLARTLHPDLNPGNKKAEERFKEVAAAHDLLSDADKRAKYDRGEIDASGAEKARYSYRSYAESGKGGKYRDFDFGFGAEDIISDIFGARTGRTQSGQRMRLKGADQFYSLKISFNEAALGETKRITLPNGKNLDVRVPPGVEDGQTLRLKGQGAPGTGGGEAGDALVEIKVESHPFFSREGHDIYLDLPVTLPEAVLGGKVTVPTVEGKVTLTVPPGSNTGTTLRLKGKGISRGKGGERGDQFVKLRVMLPDKPDAELQKFLLQWARTHDYDVRARMGMA